MSNQPEFLPRPTVISVSELNRSARDLLEHGFPLTWVAGEISNLTRATSGHWYFSLKDPQAQVRCVMFRQKSLLLDWKPENGMQVEVRALVSLYEARGEFQLNVETMRRSGSGALYQAFERLKTKLASEGLFAESRKKSLPPFPRSIGIITSPAAAALRDVVTTLRRRMPGIAVIIYPTPVQGEDAAEKISEAIYTAGRRAECDLLIVCRGGGSIEDLWAFNEEIVARALAACPIPIVCGVGHETDFTIADFVADRRAPTPTAAAELASPNRLELLAGLALIEKRLQRVIMRALEGRMQQLDYLSRRLQHPAAQLLERRAHLQQLVLRLKSAWSRHADNRHWRIRELRQKLKAPETVRLQQRQVDLATRLRRSVESHLESMRARLRNLNSHLAHLSPKLVLERGYSVVEDAAGKIIRDSAQIASGDQLKMTFARGTARARVTGKG
ncbi:MAG TPA: exodeoxyribonuclease VII large subunit [Burkholderiales bacterium]|nr:exodeoxyribonuclease VII large subunit [Burkholderiales bacterium]